MNNERNKETESSVNAEAAETPERRSFMKSLMTGAVAVGGLAAVTSENASAASGSCSVLFSSDDVRDLTSAIQAYGGKIVEYFPCGVPALDSIWGTALIRPEAAGAMIQALLKLDKFRFRLEAFPHGIPYPDLVNVRFRTPGAGGGL